MLQCSTVLHSDSAAANSGQLNTPIVSTLTDKYGNYVMVSCLKLPLRWHLLIVYLLPMCRTRTWCSPIWKLLLPRHANGV
jgi:cytochrome c-type biogenesis protein CcmH/NrfF